MTAKMQQYKSMKAYIQIEGSDIFQNFGHYIVFFEKEIEKNED